MNKAGDGKFRMSVSLSRTEGMDELDMEKLDLVFLGNPLCRITPGNPLQNLLCLEKVVESLETYLDKIVISLPVCPLANELDSIRKMLTFLGDSGVRGVEVFSPGMALRINSDFPGLKIYFGSFANVYTDQCARVMSEMNVLGGILPYELNLDEIEYINNNTDLEIWLPVFGYFPIAFSQYCYYHPDQFIYPFKCDHPCEDDLIVDYGEGRKVLHKGRAIFSHKSMNMFKHLPLLTEKGFRNFRIDGLLYNTGEINEIVDLFSRRIEEITSGNRPVEREPQEEGEPTDTAVQEKIERLRQYAPRGFCNGFYFTRFGMDYVESYIDFDGKERSLHL